MHHRCITSEVMMLHQYAAYRDTHLWRAVASMVADLQASGEVRVDTAPDYVIGYLCQELAAKGVVTREALTTR